VLANRKHPRLVRPKGLTHAGIISVAALLAGVTVPGAVNPASAQVFGYGWLNDQPKPRKQKKPSQARKQPAEEKAKAAAVPEKQPNGPLVLTISLKAQRVRVFDADGFVAEAPISSGRVGNPTPMGVFTILEKQKIHYSNLYGNAPMPNMNRITWSGVALHAGVLPGYPASHGCIRLPHSFSSRLYGMSKVGNRVVVARDVLEPQAISHPNLFVAFPAENDLTTASVGGNETKVADASGTAVGTGTSGSVLGVDAANAAAPAVSANPYREKWKAEMARRVEAVKTAESAKAEAGTAIPAAAAAAETAKSVWKAARAEWEKAATARRKTAASLADADRELTQLVKRMTSGRKISDAAAAKAAEAEEKLDQRITELTTALEAATAEEQRTSDALKAAEQAASAAETARKAAVNTLSKAEADLKAAIEASESAKRREAKRALPVSVFVSLKTQKLYIRQGYEPILEVPVTIRNPEKPIGTHVFTALALKDNKRDVDWSVVSVPTPPPQQKTETDKKKKTKEAKDLKLVPLVPDSYYADQKAAIALERITIPEDVRDLVADVMKPGSSFLISDYGLSNETGKFTDFIVALR